MTVPEIDVIAVAAFVAASTGIVLAVRAVGRFGRRVNTFFDDWYGVAADAGHEGTPGVLARLTVMEDSLSKHIVDEEIALTNLSTEVNDVKRTVGHELNRNGGSSTKDAAHEALRVVREVQMQQESEIVAHRDWRRQYDAAQVESLRQRAGFLAAIRDLFTMTPEQQIKAYDAATAAYITGPKD